ncbi:fatty acid alpha-hydroxylase [Mortierella sp. GBA35]|nr:fatty acid alpha-hydroxylase [Mortierella sp. AD031]KAF9105546.1 fatty acid alpha-hydroxylase [Mortierella sp. GBA35]KAG0220378.1 fatty acid alpha-hydroxylase [Mortierella sp. NVP41]
MSRVYTQQEVAKHTKADDCWLIHNNKVYNVSDFVADHPGGEEFILDHAGTDVTALMKDELEHLHSDGAYEMLDELLIGSLSSTPVTATAATATASAKTTATALGEPQYESEMHRRLGASVEGGKNAETGETEYYLKDTDLVADAKKNQFLDLNKPLFHQLWYANFSKTFYLEQVHIPRHVAGGSARLFSSDFLEFFTRTPWYMVPILWLPVIAFNFWRGLREGLTVEYASGLFVAGMFTWTLAEYMIHRFLFHLDDLMPESNYSNIGHFLLHGIHHYLPMDRLRLVMPPVLAIALAIPINVMMHSLMPLAQGYLMMSGLLFGYVLYDMTHYYLHHAKVFKIHFKEMKTYHLAHHYKNFEGGYGITSKVWDRVFGTTLEL